MKKILLLTFTTFLIIISCKKKERIPWDIKPQYENEFKDEVKFTEVSNLQSVISYDSISVTVPLNSTIATYQKNEIMFGMYGGTKFPNGTIRNILHKDTIGSNVILITQTVGFDMLFKGTYNLEEIDFSEHFSTFSRATGNPSDLDIDEGGQVDFVSPPYTLPNNQQVTVEYKVTWFVKKKVRYNEKTLSELDNVKEIERSTTETGSEGCEIEMKLVYTGTNEYTGEADLPPIEISPEIIIANTGWLSATAQFLVKINFKKITGEVEFKYNTARQINDKIKENVVVTTVEVPLPPPYQWQTEEKKVYSTLSKDVISSGPEEVTPNYELTAKAKVEWSIAFGLALRLRITQGVVTFLTYTHAFLKLEIEGSAGTGGANLTCDIKAGVGIEFEVVLFEILDFLNLSTSIGSLTWYIVPEFSLLQYFNERGRNICDLSQIINPSQKCQIKPFTSHVVNAGFTNLVNVEFLKYNSDGTLLNYYSNYTGQLAYKPLGGNYPIFFNPIYHLNEPCNFTDNCAQLLTPDKPEALLPIGKYVAVFSSLDNRLRISSENFEIFSSDLNSCKTIRVDNIGTSSSALISGLLSTDGC